MKKHFMTLSALAAVLLLLPCCKKDQDKDPVVIRSEMKAPTLNSGERTYLGPTLDGQTHVLWDKSDHIGVFDGVNRYEFELESGENTSNAQFTTLAKPFNQNSYSAIYPTGVNPTAQYNDNSYTVTFYLPQTQTYQEPINGIPTLDKGALPMLAYSSQYHVFNFNTPMAILKVDLIGTGWINKMVLTDLNEGNLLWGTVSVTLSAETDIPEIHSADLSNGDNTLTLNCNHTQLSETPTSFYFVVPVGTLCDEDGFNFKIDVYDLDNVPHTIEKSGVAGGYIQRATITTVAHDEMLNLDNIAGIKGLFSVGENKQVFFSQGNLAKKDFGIFMSPEYKFCFESKQYLSTSTGNYINYDIGYFHWNSNRTMNTFVQETDRNTDDVFFTNLRDEEGIECPNPDFSVRLDDGTDQAGIWRTLSAEEWMYLFSYKWDGVNSYYDDYENDTRRDMYRKGVTVVGHTNCIVLYPDGYEGTKVQDFDTETFNSESAYNAATAEGIVFLPAAGYVDYNTLHEGFVGTYWSSTPNPGAVGYAHALYFQSLEDNARWLDRYVNPKGDFPRDLNCSIRLVRDITIPAN